MKLMQFDERRLRMKITLDVFSNYCNAHQLKYSIAFGTLIGAVRHEGFIPWDDDIDVCMPFDDYMRFISEFRDENYYVGDVSYDDMYDHPYARLIDRNSFSLAGRDRHKEYGISIDIYPIYGILNREDYSEAKKKFDLLKKGLRLTNKIIGLSILLHISKPFYRLRSKILKKYYKLYRKSDISKCDYLHILDSKIFLERGKLEEYIDLRFEGSVYKAFKSYDEILTMEYGDYMQLPPEEERVPYHRSNIYSN